MKSRGPDRQKGKEGGDGGVTIKASVTVDVLHTSALEKSTGSGFLVNQLLISKTFSLIASFSAGSINPFRASILIRKRHRLRSVNAECTTAQPNPGSIWTLPKALHVSTPKTHRKAGELASGSVRVAAPLDENGQDALLHQGGVEVSRVPAQVSKQVASPGADIPLGVIQVPAEEALVNSCHLDLNRNRWITRAVLHERP
jgi:hypothetical protein